MGWGQALQRFTDVPVIALANDERERASKSGVAAEGSIAGIASADLVLIQFVAPIEAPMAAPDAAALAGLRQLIATARTLGARPLLLTPMAQRVFDSEGRAPAEHDAIAEALHALAAQERIPIIDLAAISRSWLKALGPEASKAWYFHDPATGYSDLAALHERGAYSIACLVLSDLIAVQQLDPRLLTRPLDCAITERTAVPGTKTRQPLLEHIDAIPQHGIERHGSSGLALAAELFPDESTAAFGVERLVLHAGAALGVHQHLVDEIFYVISGRAELSIAGQAHAIGPGSSVMTPAGSPHSLRQVGAVDLVLLSIRPR